MNKIMTIGLDLAKNLFHLVCCDEHGKVVRKKMLRRSQVLQYFANLAPCLVGMEACASAHHWARSLGALGHEVKLMPPQYVKPYVRGNKNDYNDALAIAEAVTRPEMRFVAVKSTEQQDIQALHRLREKCGQDRTALCNQLRGLLAEYGVILPQGVNRLRRRLPELLEDGENGLSDLFRQLLAQGYQQLQELDGHIESYTQEMKRQSQQGKACGRLQTIPGFGPIVASVFHSVIGNGEAFRRGRDVSASLGLVPRQHSSGGKPHLLGISKRGNRYIRTLLIHGSRSVIRAIEGKTDPLSRWLQGIKVRRGANVAAVALANKNARILWALATRAERYHPAG